MAKKPDVKVIDEEITFESEGLDAKALITKTNKRGIITFASRAYRSMTKYSKEELVGKSHNVVRHPCMPETAFKEMWDTILSCKRWVGFVKNLRKDGKYYWVIVKIEAVDKNGDIATSPDEIDSFVAIRREPSRKDIEKVKKDYKIMRKAELLEKKKKGFLKDWELELFERL